MIGLARVAAATAAALLMSSGGALAAGMSRKSLNMTLANTSPLLTYTPTVSMPDLPVNASEPGNVTFTHWNASNQWNVSFSDRAWSQWAPDQIGNGTSNHWTSKPGATVELSWVGTAVYFYGSITGNVELTIDGGQPQKVVQNPDQALVGGTSGLTYALHTAKLTLTSGSLSITNVTIVTGLDTEAATGASAPTYELPGILGAGQNVNPAIASYQKDLRAWNHRDKIGPPDAQFDYFRIDTVEQWSWFKFAVPANTTLMTLTGSIGWNHGRYSVAISPDPPMGLPANSTLNGYCPYSALHTTLFLTQLDPKIEYNVTFVNMDNNTWVDFEYATFYNGTVIHQEAGLSRGAVAGITIGSLLGAVFLGLLVFFFIKRRNEEKYSEVIDDEMTEAGIISPRGGAVAGGHPLNANMPMPMQSLHTVLPRSHSLSSHGHGHDGNVYAGDSSQNGSQYLQRGLSSSSGANWRASSLVSGESEHMGSERSMALKREILASGKGYPPIPGLGGHMEEDNVYVTDTDAGPAHAPAQPQVQLMPPSYNPEWANTSPTDAVEGGESMSPASSTAPGESPLSALSPHLHTVTIGKATRVPLPTPPAAAVSRSNDPRRRSTYKPPLPQ